MKMTQEEFKNALELHEKWLSNEPDGVKLDLRHSDLSGLDLSYADLRRADLSNANLSRANLSGSKLIRTDLSRANLSRANLSCSKLRRADLRRADLSGSYLRFAILSDADLRWAHTINTEGLDVICVQLNTSDKNRQVQYYVQLDKVTAGCFMGTLDELKKAVDENHHKDSVIYKRYQIAFKTIEDILDTY